jgi:uncharacterized protein (TIGR02271 family)
MSRDGDAEHEAHVDRHEEILRVGTRETAATLRARKTVDTEPVSTDVGRRAEQLGEIERVETFAEDSGEIETLPDGSISIPLLEEVLVVEKRVVVRERVILRKLTTQETEQVQAELRRERIDFDQEPGEPR